MSYLFITNLVAKIERAHNAINNRVCEYAKQGDLEHRIEEKRTEYSIECRKNLGKSDNKNKQTDRATDPENAQANREQPSPRKILETEAKRLKQSQCEEILETILGKSPYELESLFLKLMRSMGYGDKKGSHSWTTPKSCDGGIDGIVYEDKLGLNSIAFQVKRYTRERSVSVEAVRAFIGALIVHEPKLEKGVFATTSKFSKLALECAKKSPVNLVLIDGEKLAQLVYEHGLGMREVATIKIKEFDSGFWDAMEGKMG